MARYHKATFPFVFLSFLLFAATFTFKEELSTVARPDRPWLSLAWYKVECQWSLEATNTLRV